MIQLDKLQLEYRNNGTRLYSLLVYKLSFSAFYQSFPFVHTFYLKFLETSQRNFH